MKMDPEFDRLCDDLDAAVFSGAWLSRSGNVAGLKEYLARWGRAVDEMEKLNAERESNNG